MTEFALFEGVVENHNDGGLLENFTSHIASLIDLVPEHVEAGLHLCYGDSGHKYFCKPSDTGHLVTVSNGVSVKIGRPITWIHMPVPRDQDDAAYNAPLTGLTLQDTTEPYLRLVHHTGGQAGTEKRIAAAQSARNHFGIATECGLARRDRDTMSGLIEQHANLSDTA